MPRAPMALVELAILAAVAVFASRGVRPAPPPHGRRFWLIACLLLLQLLPLYGFLAFYRASAWGVAHASPPGILLLTQLVRLALLVWAGRLWLGMALEQLPGKWERLLMLVAFLLFAAGGQAFVGATVLFFVLRRMKWLEGWSGWRRAAALLLTALLLLPLIFMPGIMVTGGKADWQLSLGAASWPAALLAPGAAARHELALTAPLDHAVRGALDVFRVQLVVCAVQFLFLPIKLSGVSLERRFWLNHVLVRSIPSVFSALVVLGLVYLGFGYSRGVRLRGAFDETLARAATAARALEPGARSRDPAELDRVRGWMGPEGASAWVVARQRADSIARTSPGTPPGLLEPPLSSTDTTITRGLYVRGDGIYLVAVDRGELGSTEVWVRVDSTYLARTMQSLGGNASVVAQPHLFVGSRGVRVTGDSSWMAHAVVARHLEPDSIAGRSSPWFLTRFYLPVGSWREAGQGWRGAAEVTLGATPRSLIMSGIRARNSLYSGLFLLVVVAAVAILFGMLESFAVRSGRSIVRAVLEEARALRTAADEFGAGHLDYRLPVRGQDEFSVVASSFNQMAMNLERQRRELIEAERLEEDLAVARGIQQRFLPQEAPCIPGLDLAGVSIPSKEVGGDLFYWFSHEGERLGFVLGDVSGKSVPAALLMSNVLAALRAQADVELSACVERTNRLIIEQIEPGRFVTLFYGEAHPKEGTLRYVSAGHNPALVVGGGGITWLREGGVPLGVLPGASYRTATVDLAPGDTVVVYSDGVTEAERPIAASAGAEAQPEMFGEERLAAVAQAMCGRPAREMLEGVLQAVRDFAGAAEQADDITIVVVRRA
jgi:serine phosphatase RsbU (regulator of sigma subunit)